MSAPTLAEVVQLQRAEQQMNPDPEDRAAVARLKWEMRLAYRKVRREGAGPQRQVAVRLPLPVYEALAHLGSPTIVARSILVRWAMRKPPKRGGSMGGP